MAQNFLRFLPIDDLNDKKKKVPNLDIATLGGVTGADADTAVPPINPSGPQRTISDDLSSMFKFGNPNPNTGGEPGMNGQYAMPAPPIDDALAGSPEYQEAQKYGPMFGQPDQATQDAPNIDPTAPMQGGQLPASDPATASPMEPLTGSAKTKAEIDELSAPEGRERFREGSIWKRLGSGLKHGLIEWSKSGGQGGLAGALGAIATGGVTGATSPGAMSEWKRDIAVDKLWNRLGQETQAEARMAQTADVQQRPIQRQLEIERKQEADRQKVLHNEAILADKKRGRDLTETQINDLRTWRQYLMEQGAKVNEAKIKQIDERLKDYDLDRESRERIAAQNRRSREGIAASGRQERTGRAQARDAMQASAAIQRAREKGAKEGYPPEQIEQDIQAYINTLPAHIQQQLRKR